MGVQTGGGRPLPRSESRCYIEKILKIHMQICFSKPFDCKTGLYINPILPRWACRPHTAHPWGGQLPPAPPPQITLRLSDHRQSGREMSRLTGERGIHQMTLLSLSINIIDDSSGSDNELPTISACTAPTRRGLYLGRSMPVLSSCYHNKIIRTAKISSRLKTIHTKSYSA